MSVPRRCTAHACAFGLACAIAAGAPAAATPEKPHFDMLEIRVAGNTVLPQEKVEEAVYPYLGPDKTADDLEKARAALEKLYNDAQYPTVSVIIPQQHLSEAGGVFALQVIERPVGRLRVTGAHYFVPNAVRAGAPSLAPGTVPNFAAVKRDLLALNGFNDRAVRPDLHAGHLPDTVDVDLNVEDSLPLHGSLEVNNRYNADTHAERLSASLSYDNFFQRGDSGTLGYTVAPEDVRDAEVSSASYLLHIPDRQLSVLFSYLHSNSNVTALSSTEVAGRGTTVGFRLLVPLGTTSDFSHSFQIGWDYKRYFELDTFLSSKQLTTAPLTYYPVSATYTGSWFGDNGTVTNLSLGLEFGLGNLGSTSAQFYNKAYAAAPGFSVARATLSRLQSLPHDVQLYGAVTAQMTNDSLVSSEQIAAGGADTVRGYLEAETLADKGFTLQTELRSPDVATYFDPAKTQAPVKNWRFHLFYDAGDVALVQPQTGVRSSYGLQSVGVGSRINLWGYLNGVLQDAQTLNAAPNTKAGTNRVLFRVYGEF